MAAPRRSYVVVVPPSGLLEPQLQAAAAVADAGRADSRSRRINDFLLAMFPATLGAATGYYLSALQPADIWLWTGAGAVVGLLVGWDMVRWMARKH